MKYHPLDDVNRRINFYPDLLKQANDNGFDSLYEYVLAIYDQWESITSVASYLKMTRRGTKELMKAIKVPVRAKRGGANNRCSGFALTYLGSPCARGHDIDGKCTRYRSCGKCVICVKLENLKGSRK